MGKSSSKPLSLNGQVVRAIQIGDIYTFDELIEFHPHLLIKPVNDNLWSPLMLACMSERSLMVQHLIDNYKIDIDERDYNGFTALLHCAYKNTYEANSIAEILCIKGADLSIKTNSGVTAFNIASLNKNRQLIKILEYHQKYGKWARHPFQSRKKLLWIYPQSKFKVLPKGIIKDICMYM